MKVQETMKAFNSALKELPKDVYEKFKEAIAIGKWENGQPLTQDQRELLMECIIRYELMHVRYEDRLGFIQNSCKTKQQIKLDIIK